MGLEIESEKAFSKESYHWEMVAWALNMSNSCWLTRQQGQSIQATHSNEVRPCPLWLETLRVLAHVATFQWARSVIVMLVHVCYPPGYICCISRVGRSCSSLTYTASIILSLGGFLLSCGLCRECHQWPHWEWRSSRQIIQAEGMLSCRARA